MPKNGNSRRKRAARAVQSETGMPYTAALREADRRHAEAEAATEAADQIAAGVAQAMEAAIRACLPVAAASAFPEAVFRDAGT